MGEEIHRRALAGGPEMTADEKTYSLQPCFGIEYEAGTLFCENCRDKKECWVKMETGCIPTAGGRSA